MSFEFHGSTDPKNIERRIEKLEAWSQSSFEVLEKKVEAAEAKLHRFENWGEGLYRKVVDSSFSTLSGALRTIEYYRGQLFSGFARKSSFSIAQPLSFDILQFKRYTPELQITLLPITPFLLANALFEFPHYSILEDRAYRKEEFDVPRPSEPAPDTIRDFDEALRQKNPTAVVLKPFFDQFLDSKSKHSDDIALLLDRHKKEIDQMLIQNNYFQIGRGETGYTYGRTSVFFGTLSRNEDGKPKEYLVELMAMRMVPKSSSGVHPHHGRSVVSHFVNRGAEQDVYLYREGKFEYIRTDHIQEGSTAGFPSYYSHDIRNVSEGDLLIVDFFYVELEPGEKPPLPLDRKDFNYLRY